MRLHPQFYREIHRLGEGASLGQMPNRGDKLAFKVHIFVFFKPIVHMIFNGVKT